MHIVLLCICARTCERQVVGRGLSRCETQSTQSCEDDENGCPHGIKSRDDRRRAADQAFLDATTSGKPISLQGVVCVQSVVYHTGVEVVVRLGGSGVGNNVLEDRYIYQTTSSGIGMVLGHFLNLMRSFSAPCSCTLHWPRSPACTVRG